ncbi:MAG: glycine--tRNA ligase subunit beta [Acidobacteria bacterium]|nr:glycine--tRNA ligase subunit beta [Acidobacteriota bacterium]
MQTLEFLLEIGVEEIPDWMIPRALESFHQRFREALDKAGLAAGVQVRAEATSRRLTLLVDGLPAGQADKSETLSGPPASIAYDDEGNLTKAGLGFAKRAGVEASALKVGSDGKLTVVRSIAGRPTGEILAEALPEIILGIYFPKNMVWTGKGGPRFIRPIRWLVALLGGAVVEFEIAGVKAGRTTYGHRRLGQGALEVGSIAAYEAKLAGNFVVLSADERRRRIVEGSRAALPAGAGLVVRDNPKLLETLTYLTEYPSVIYGEFEERYLALPDEVLETVMLVHQKYFAVASEATGKLVNGFLAVANLDGDPDGEIRRGAVRVLRARFNDAEFFWNADLEKPLSARVSDLEKVTFQAQLGSYFDKSERMRKIAAALCAAAGVEAAVAQRADRAAELAKTDLTTGMVGEFPELQGVMGGLYAAEQGEPAEVADAIYDHYKPAGAGDSIPRTPEGRVVAIADKLDTLGGLFRLGMLPTGSRDPFALRRSAYGIIRILVEGRMRVSIDELVAMAEAGEHAAALREFLVERLRFFLTEAGYQYDEINAVLAADDKEPLDAATRCAAIAKVRPTENFEPLAVSFKRVRNILEKAGGVEAYAAKPLDESLLEAGAEGDLYAAFQTVQQDAASARSGGDYPGALERIASLRPALDRFFEDVLVMAKDDAIRENRLAFLAKLLRELSTIADFSEIVSGAAA